MSPKDPFHVLCLGRLSRFKSPGIRAMIENATELKKAIPSLKISVIGSGRRIINLWAIANKANLAAGEKFIRFRGTQSNPLPFFEDASVVCAGATSAIEAILCNRPVVAFSGFWMGKVTTDNVDECLANHFGERQGEFYLKDRLEIVCQSLIEIYREWDDQKVAQSSETLRQQLAPEFDGKTIADRFSTLCRQLIS